MSNALVNLQEQLKQELATLKNTVPTISGRAISTKGKVFTLPDGTSSPGPIQLVVLDHRNFNRYYTAAYNPQDIKPPLCFAISKDLDLKPHEAATEPQAESCEICPHNQWGSAPNGGKGKACRNTVRLAVAPPDASVDDDPYLLNLAPTSLRSWASYVSGLQVRELLPIQVITEVSFDQAAAYPVLQFKALGTHEVLETMWALREKAQAQLDAPPQGTHD